MVNEIAEQALGKVNIICENFFWFLALGEDEARSHLTLTYCSEWYLIGKSSGFITGEGE
jgi:hypothetical protein